MNIDQHIRDFTVNTLANIFPELLENCSKEQQKSFKTGHSHNGVSCSTSFSSTNPRTAIHGSKLLNLEKHDDVTKRTNENVVPHVQAHEPDEIIDIQKNSIHPQIEADNNLSHENDTSAAKEKHEKHALFCPPPKHFTFSLPLQEFNKYWLPNQHRLKRGWTTIFRNEFRKYNKYCKFYNYTHYANIPAWATGEIKEPVQNLTFFTSDFYCVENCYTFKCIIEEFPPESYDDINGTITVKVISNGNYNHSAGEKFIAPISGEQRKQVLQQSKGMAPCVFSEKTKMKVLKQPDVVAEGNYSGYVQASILHKIKHDERQKEITDKDDFKDLDNRYMLYRLDESFAAEPPGVIQRLMKRKFHVSVWTARQNFILVDYAKSRRQLFLHFDSTKGAIRRINPEDKELYYYALVFKDLIGNRPMMQVFEAYAADHTVAGILLFLAPYAYELRAQIPKDVYIKVETDMSLANIHAISIAFNGFDGVKLCNEITRASIDEVKLFVLAIIHVCGAHFVKFMQPHLRKFAGDDSGKIRAELFKLLNTYVAALQTCRNMKKAVELVAVGTVVFSSPYATEQVGAALESLQHFSHKISSKESAAALDKEVDEYLKKYRKPQRGADKVYAASIRRDESICTHIFAEVISASLEKIPKINVHQYESNYAYCPELMTYLQTNLFQMFPLFSAIGLSFIPFFNENDIASDTNAVAETWMHYHQHTKRSESRNLTAGEAVQLDKEHILLRESKYLNEVVTTRQEKTREKLLLQKAEKENQRKREGKKMEDDEIIESTIMDVNVDSGNLELFDLKEVFKKKHRQSRKKVPYVKQSMFTSAVRVMAAQEDPKSKKIDSSVLPKYYKPGVGILQSLPITPLLLKDINLMEPYVNICWNNIYVKHASSLRKGKYLGCLNAGERLDSHVLNDFLQILVNDAVQNGHSIALLPSEYFMRIDDNKQHNLWRSVATCLSKHVCLQLINKWGHWMLGVVLLAENQFFLFNSSYDYYKDDLRELTVLLLRSYEQHLEATEYRKVSYDWNVIYPQCKQQQNIVDCGVIVAEIAAAICLGYSWKNIQDADNNSFRNIMGRCLLQYSPVKCSNIPRGKRRKPRSSYISNVSNVHLTEHSQREPIAYISNILKQSRVPIHSEADLIIDLSDEDAQEDTAVNLSSKIPIFDNVTLIDDEECVLSDAASEDGSSEVIEVFKQTNDISVTPPAHHTSDQIENDLSEKTCAIQNDVQPLPLLADESMTTISGSICSPQVSKYLGDNLYSNLFEKFLQVPLPEINKYKNDLDFQVFQSMSVLLNNSDPYQLRDTFVTREVTDSCLNGMLEDPSINYYLKSITKETEESEAWICVKYIPTELLTKFKTIDSENKDLLICSSYLDVIELFKADVILFMLNVPNIHWALGALVKKTKRIYVLDSNNAPGSNYKKQWLSDTQTIIQHLGEAYEKQMCQSFPHTWSFYYPTNIPQQNDGISCGVYACYYAYMICQQKRDIPFNIEEFRRSIAAASKSNALKDQDEVIDDLVKEHYILDAGTKANNRAPIRLSMKADTNDALMYLLNLKTLLFKATLTKCVKSNCKSPSEDMHFCFRCSDWYHKACCENGIGTTEDTFSCPECSNYSSASLGKKNFWSKKSPNRKVSVSVIDSSAMQKPTCVILEEEVTANSMRKQTGHKCGTFNDATRDSCEKAAIMKTTHSSESTITQGDKNNFEASMRMQFKEGNVLVANDFHKSDVAVNEFELCDTDKEHLTEDEFSYLRRTSAVELRGERKNSSMFSQDNEDDLIYSAAEEINLNQYLVPTADDEFLKDSAEVYENLLNGTGANISWHVIDRMVQRYLRYLLAIANEEIKSSRHTLFKNQVQGGKKANLPPAIGSTVLGEKLTTQIINKLERSIPLTATISIYNAYAYLLYVWLPEFLLIMIKSACNTRDKKEAVRLMELIGVMPENSANTWLASHLL